MCHIHLRVDQEAGPVARNPVVPDACLHVFTMADVDHIRARGLDPGDICVQTRDRFPPFSEMLEISFCCWFRQQSRWHDAMAELR